MPHKQLKLRFFLVIMIFAFIMQTSFSSETILIPGASASVKKNYLSETVDAERALFWANPTRFQKLKEDFFGIFGTSVITGLSFKYRNYGISQKFANYTIFGGTANITYANDLVPFNLSETWHTKYFKDTWMMTINPQVEMTVGGEWNEYLLIAADNHVSGHSWAMNNASGGSFIIDTMDYIIDVIYENVVMLPTNQTQFGTMPANDFVDAYNVFLYAGKNYTFDLYKTMGSADVDLKICAYNVDSAVGSSYLAIATGSSYPESVTFNCFADNSYVLLVYKNSGTIDYYLTMTDSTTATSTNSSASTNSTTTSTSSSIDPLQYIFEGTSFLWHYYGEFYTGVNITKGYYVPAGPFDWTYQWTCTSVINGVPLGTIEVWEKSKQVWGGLNETCEMAMFNNVNGTEIVKIYGGRPIIIISIESSGQYLEIDKFTRMVVNSSIKNETMFRRIELISWINEPDSSSESPTIMGYSEILIGLFSLLGIVYLLMHRKPR